MSALRTWLIFHLQPASQLFSELSTGPHAWTHSSEQHDISSSEVMWFLESPKADVSHASASTWIISPRWVYSSLCLFLFYRLGGDSGVTDQSRCWLRLIFATCISVFESVLLFNVCPTLYCHSQEQRNKKPLFSCRGCNSMLSKPIVLQGLHLFFSCIVYWACGSGRRLDRHNYAASQTSETAFPFTWISVFLKPKVRVGWINMFILFSYGSQRFMQMLSSTALTITYSCKYDEQVIYSQHWLSHSIVRVCLALGFYLFRAELAESFKQLPACVWEDVCRSFFWGVTESFKMWMLYWKQVFCISA